MDKIKYEQEEYLKKLDKIPVCKDYGDYLPIMNKIGDKMIREVLIMERPTEVMELIIAYQENRQAYLTVAGTSKIAVYLLQLEQRIENAFALTNDCICSKEKLRKALRGEK